MLSVLLLVGGALLGGLLLNLMPCVLPVLAIKIMSLLKLRDTPHLAWKYALAYTAGVVGSLLILAGAIIGVHSVGGLLMWGFQFQHLWFNWAIAGILWLMGLYQLGVGITLLTKLKDRLKLNYGVSEAIGAKFKAVGPLCSSFGQGILAALIGTACTAPFLGAVIGISFTLAWPLTLLLFACIGLGMAAPYVLFALFPQYIKRLPRPGKWSLWLKYIMGIIMLLTSGWFVWLTF